MVTRSKIRRKRGVAFGCEQLMIEVNMNKFLPFIVLILLLNGCATYEKRVYLSPTGAPAWVNTSPRHYQSGCNEGEVEVSPIVLGVEGEGSMDLFVPIPGSRKRLNMLNEKGPWVLVSFRNKTRIESCELSYVSLENQDSGDRIIPISAETHVYNDDHFEKHRTDCYYYFDLGKDIKSRYNLSVSKEIFNCIIEPIPYIYEKVFEMSPRQMM
ncbi:MAG: hypothetical protein WC552_03730 [Candidatus Omnitrophota bacterium]